MMYGSWDTKWERQNVLSFWPIFCLFYKCTPQMTIIWCMVPEIWSMTDIIFCHSGPFFALLPPYGPRKSKFWKNEKNKWTYYHFTNVYHKWQSHDVWLLRYGVPQTEFFVILDHFCYFTPPPPNSPKNQNYKKKKPGDIIILYICTKNYDQMMYSSWNMVRDRCKCYFSLWAIFFFTPITAQKIKILKK